MAENPSEQLISLQQLSHTLGCSLAAEEYQHCLKQVKVLKPKVGKFWQGEVASGIYIVTAGKVSDTATVEVIVRQRRIIDFILDPFKKLQQGGVKL